MSSQFFFAGQETLRNRGCEALLRGISTIVLSNIPDATFAAPSFDIAADEAQWAATDENHSMNFIPAYRLSKSARVWAKLANNAKPLRRYYVPRPKIPDTTLRALGAFDAAFMTGGDILSLDYGIPSLIKWVGQAEHVHRLGKPVFLWAGSLGPFTAEPDIEEFMKKHLQIYDDISVRESSTLEYLDGIGIRNARLVADPAFVMKPEAWNVEETLPSEIGDGVLGFNISPLIKQFRGSQTTVSEMETGVIEFFKDIITKTKLSLLLIPHVDTVDGTEWNSDFLYMRRLFNRANLPKERVSLAPRAMNAPQVKHLISQCRFFIGARTHSTIAAWSTLVPTISIAYSVKATGLNTDLFGNLDYVLPTPEVSRTSLWTAFEKLSADEGSLRTLLATRIPIWKEKAHTAADGMAQLANRT